MGYVKGCELVILSNYVMKKIEKGQYVMNNDLQFVLSVEEMRRMLDKANSYFVNAEGNVDKGRTAGQILMMTKKIEKKRVILGVAAFERVAGAPSGKTGVAAWFAESTDRYVLSEKLFAPGFEQEEEYFDESVLRHFKDVVGFGQVKEVEYLDKLVAKTDKRTFLGSPITQTAYFVLMMILWGVIFQNPGIGFVFALIFSSSFTMITANTKAQEKPAEF